MSVVPGQLYFILGWIITSLSDREESGCLFSGLIDQGLCGPVLTGANVQWQPLPAGSFLWPNKAD